jgi:hypothetical protein
MPAASATGRGSHRTPVLVILLASYLMIVLDISIVITALPKMHAGLGFSTTGLSWGLVFAFVLAVALIVRVHRTADIAGHPPVSQAASRT